MGRYSRLGNALYEGDVSINFVGRKRLWFSFSGLILVLAVFGLVHNGLDLGIEFKGGNEFTIGVPTGQATQANADKLRTAVAGAGVDNAKSPIVNTSGPNSIKVQTEVVTEKQGNQLTTLMANAVGVPEAKVSEESVGPSYGSQVAKQALTGLIVFLILVGLFIWAYFREWKMSIGALVALAHDLVITIGIYALSGFEVTPATVTGLLTILGFSLYDTVVVFDKVRENTRNLRAARTTYARAANLAVNQTLVRSINTTLVALLPVGAILYVGIATLGSGALKDLALALFIGMAAGTYSSVFVATPLVVALKAGEKDVEDAERRAKARSRREADRYASVPVFTEDMPIQAEPVQQHVDNDGRAAPVAPVTAPPRRPEATGSGRVVPTSKAPLSESRSAGRNQPSRRPRSKRPKK